MDDDLEVPLLPLTDAVCFPHADLEVPLASSEDRRRLLAAVGPDGRLGCVLAKPEGAVASGGSPVYAAGTLVRVSPVIGTAERIRLEGVARLTLEQPPRRGRDGVLRAAVRMVAEAPATESDPEVARLRRRLVEVLLRADRALGDACPIPSDEVELLLSAPFPVLVNRVAQSWEVPPARKLELLAESLVERARETAGIVWSDARLQELLAPYRHLASAADRN